MSSNKLKPETRLLHSGYNHKNFEGAQAVPIVQTSSFRFNNSEHAASLFDMNEFGNVYSRIMNPTNDVLEKRMTELEGGAGGLAFSSGQAAIAASIMTLASAGDEIIASRALYGGTDNLFRHAFKKIGSKVHFIPVNEIEQYRHLINARTKAVYTESISNPSLEIADLNHISEVAHSEGLPLIVDNTVSPYIFKPFDQGADIIVYSATKFIGGHGNSIGGILIDSGKFDWDTGRFPLISGPDPEFHGLEFIKKFKEIGNIAYILKARTAILRDFGGCMSPFNAFLILQGLETLPLRMKKHIENAGLIADYLRKNKHVSWVNYPGHGRTGNDLRALSLFPDGAGAIIGFGINGGKENGKKFIDSLALIAHLANIGDTRTLAIHPTSTTHSRLSESEKRESGLTDDYIRLSVGIEHPDDIKDDLEQALKRSQTEENDEK